MVNSEDWKDENIVSFNNYRAFKNELSFLNSIFLVWKTNFPFSTEANLIRMS